MAAPPSRTDINRVNQFIPFWAWNRLESRPRKKELKDSLRAELYDGLWMIGRQWQLGEFKGNDTGSGILARTSMDYFGITGIGPIGVPAVPYNQEMPIEAIVEPVVPVWSLKEKFLIGQKWLRLLNQYLPNNADFSTYKALFQNDPDLVIREQDLNVGTSETNVLDILKTASKPGVNAFLNSCDKKGIRLDGAKIYFLLMASSWSNDLATRFSTVTAQTFTTDFSTARTAFLTWIQKQYNLTEAGKYWDKQSLEYCFKTEWQSASGQSAILESNNYQNKSIDWYSVTQSNVLNTFKEPNNKTRQIIMTQSRFPGMPSSRWWEMENGSVNFCEVNADTTDVAKILATQFALVYQDDWFVIPYKVPVGSYSSVKGIVVTDVFGITTFISNYEVESYNANDIAGFKKSTEDWMDWRWMEISGQQVTNTTTSTTEDTASGKLAVLPVIHRQQQSIPIEEIIFARDEVADLVWAIEKVVPDELGRGMDGFKLSNVFLEKLKQFRPPTTVDVPSNAPGAPLDYKLMDATVPENCIPFIPVHVPNSNRSIRFQRAAMPRTVENYPVSLVRPSTSLLKTDSNVYQPYYINEEEVSRAGVIIQTRSQRTRWYNGKIISWTNYQNGSGRGSTSMNLEYDSLKGRESTSANTAGSNADNPIVGALAWWRADDPLNALVGGRFDQLHDSSGNQNHLSAPNPNTRPFAISNWKNNKPAMGFNGAEALRLATLTLPPNTTDFTVFLVGEKTLLDSSGKVVLELTDNFSNGNAWIYVTDDNGLDYVSTHGNGYNLHGMPPGLSLNNKAVQVLGISLSDPNPETYIDFKDQIYQEIANNGFLADNSGIFPDSSFNVGARSGSTSFTHYNIAELILFPTKLSADRIEAIKTYLKQKYQLVELPVTGALAWWRADNPVNTITGKRFDRLYDGSGNQNHLDALSPNTRPFVISNWKNNKPAIAFNGAEALRLATLALPPNTTDFTVFLVGEKTFLGSSGKIVLEYSDAFNSGTAWAYVTDEFGLDYVSTHGNGYNLHGMPQGLSMNNKAVQVLSINMSDPNPETYIDFKDQIYQEIANGGLLADNSGSFPDSSFNVGARSGSTSFTHYNIAELILFPTKLSPSDIEDVKNYLKSRYKL